MPDNEAPSSRPLLKRKRALLAEEARRLRRPKIKLPATPLEAFLARLRGDTYDKPDRKTCGAKTRKGTPCCCLALPNGRCKLHGGLSTGPQTPEGWARTRAAHAAYMAARKREKPDK